MTTRIVNEGGQDGEWRCDVCKRLVHQFYEIHLERRALSIGMPTHVDDDTDLCESEE